jgi:HlyD family secretion protein
VESVQAQLDASDKNLSYASIYSPVDGVVMTRNISVGQTVAASFSTPTLFVVAKDITRMQVQAAVSEADIGDVKVGLRVTFTVDAYPDITFSGTVNQIRLEPAVSANVVTYSTIITAPNDDLKLRPGMTANIFIYTKEVDSALLISAKDLKFSPDAALANQYGIVAAQKGQSSKQGSGQQAAAHRPGLDTSAHHNHNHDSTGQEVDTTSRTQRASVWVKVGDSVVEKRIRIGLNDDTHVQVLKGLSIDDDVITGVELPVKGPVASGAPAQSPFMPARRGGATRPAGAGGGGAGRPAGGGR